jgi:hypothetical protein
MKKLFAVLSTIALLVVGTTLSAQSTSTDTWTNVPSSGSCQPATKAPSYYCFAQVVEDNGTSTLGIYVTVQPDGTFANGHIYKSPLYNYPPSFTAVNWTGTFLNNTFSGTFSGIQPDGTPFSGYASETLGTVKRCAGRYGCHYETGLVSGYGNATYGQ